MLEFIQSYTWLWTIAAICLLGFAVHSRAHLLPAQAEENTRKYRQGRKLSDIHRESVESLNEKTSHEFWVPMAFLGGLICLVLAAVGFFTS